MKQYRVLLIDDEEELVSTLVERLELRGIEAEAVTRGQAALDLLEKKRFDVVVADLKMPGMSGLEVMRTIRETYPDTKVLMITGHGAEDDETAEVREGE
ncbi:MAG TPA: response regulator, partial [Bacteroidetes bacterium]|nr:response regulator [Bacteroidota bacterium]